MEMPSWFGVSEFYAIIYTVWFVLIIYLITIIIKTKEIIKVKSSITKIKSWWNNRKKRKEEKLLGGIN